MKHGSLDEDDCPHCDAYIAMRDAGHSLTVCPDCARFRVDQGAWSRHFPTADLASNEGEFQLLLTAEGDQLEEDFDASP